MVEGVLKETDAHIIKAKNSPVPVQVQEVYDMTVLVFIKYLDDHIKL